MSQSEDATMMKLMRRRRRKKKTKIQRLR